LGGGFGPAIPGGIAWRDVRLWCEFHDMSGEDVAMLDSYLRDMDGVFFAWHAAKRAAAAKK
jgi:hypothetical protein